MYDLERRISAYMGQGEDSRYVVVPQTKDGQWMEDILREIIERLGAIEKKLTGTDPRPATYSQPGTGSSTQQDAPEQEASDIAC